MKLPTAGLVVIKKNRILLAYSNNKQAWYLPGGKIDQGETPIEGLIREIKEELSINLMAEELHYLFHVSAPAYGEPADIIMEQECFLYNHLTEEIHVDNEIGAVRYFSYEEYLNEPIQVFGVLIVFDKLNENRLIEFHSV